MKVINRKSTYLLLLLVICLLGFVLVPTYAKFVDSFTTEGDVVGLSLVFDLGISNIEEYEEIVIPAFDSEQFNVEITNSTGDIAYYGIWYKMVEPSHLESDMQIGKLEGTEVSTTGTIETSGKTTVSIAIVNDSNQDMKVNIGVGSSSTAVSDIEYLGGKYLISGSVKIPLQVNEPNLDSGNLIPVYYDTIDEVWRKADSSNGGNSWYDYENKEWANAVLISDSTTRATYQTIAVDEEVPESVIDAFYVWIPRFKYRVWNISRQAGEESTYAYNAYTSGIEIVFEDGTANTGNVSCTYNELAVESDTELSDICVYKEVETITANSVNANYTDAWYTHPAFTLGTEEKTGFWIGKFETSGSTSAPTIVPDVTSLTSQTLSTFFTTSKVFQNYGLSSEIDAHMLTNLEWGAVAYLTHSVYGLCSENSCRGVYFNNSSFHYTGRSGGAVSGSSDLQLTNFYGSSVTTATEHYNTNGYYNYKGYKIDNSGAVTTTKDTTKLGSTTENVTGVYDISGGAGEYVMAVMLNNTGDFYTSTSSSGTDWNGSTTLDSKYYHTYSYSTSNLTFNRARLGDATGEILGSNANNKSGWMIGSGITGGSSSLLNTEYPWADRGGNYDRTDAGAFYFGRTDGGIHYGNTFRSALA